MAVHGMVAHRVAFGVSEMTQAAVLCPVLVRRVQLAI